MTFEGSAVPTGFAFGGPDKRYWVFVPVGSDRFKGMANLLRGGRIGSIQGAPLEKALDRCSPIEPTTSERCK